VGVLLSKEREGLTIFLFFVKKIVKKIVCDIGFSFERSLYLCDKIFDQNFNKKVEENNLVLGKCQHVGKYIFDKN
jgi:hypothetical protein